MNQWYATKTAREWNVRRAGVGFVCEFKGHLVGRIGVTGTYVTVGG